MSIDHADGQLWQEYARAEKALVAARMALVARARDLKTLIDRALVQPAERGLALRLLLTLPPDASNPHVARLALLAAVGHSDVATVRQVLCRLKTADSRATVAIVLDAILSEGGEAEFRRVAELYAECDDEQLAAHLRRCSLHDDDAVREVAEDFKSTTLLGG